MDLTNLVKITKRPKKRVGRGYGSGKGGHSSGRGSKGQHARNSVAIWFEGGQLPLIKRLPFQRGKSRFKPLKATPMLVGLDKLNLLSANTQVTLETLIQHHLIKTKHAHNYRVKIVNTGKLDKAIHVALPTSKTAASAITKAGGSIEKQQ